jgi:hypothetical protein
MNSEKRRGEKEERREKISGSVTSVIFQKEVFWY